MERWRHQIFQSDYPKHLGELRKRAFAVDEIVVIEELEIAALSGRFTLRLRLRTRGRPGHRELDGPTILRVPYVLKACAFRQSMKSISVAEMCSRFHTTVMGPNRMFVSMAIFLNSPSEAM
jgi:hypothetical protein